MATKKIWTVYEIGAAAPLTEIEASSEWKALDHVAAFYGVHRDKLYAVPGALAASAPVDPQMSVHGVLAGAYRGARANLKELLTHASADSGSSAVCGDVTEGNLCDLVESGPPTCKKCARKYQTAARGR